MQTSKNKQISFNRHILNKSDCNLLQVLFCLYQLDSKVFMIYGLYLAMVNIFLEGKISAFS